MKKYKWLLDIPERNNTQKILSNREMNTKSIKK